MPDRADTVTAASPPTAAEAVEETAEPRRRELVRPATAARLAHHLNAFTESSWVKSVFGARLGRPG
jgi:hypothetical protein